LRVDLSGSGLPLVPYLPRISSTLERSRCLVLTAEPGAGKSTLVPPYLMETSWLSGAKIVMLEPRRLAAAAVASRISELLGEPLGRRAGYRVRSAAHVSSETRIEVVTEALLTRKIQEDPLLEGIGLVIFDEFHERSIHADLALALAIEVKRARPDLALLVMSATLDPGPVASLLGGAPVLSCPGKSFPVETRYRPPRGRTRWEEDLADDVALLFDDTQGDTLVFLPGVGEINRVRSRLEESLGARAEVLALHGTLSLEEQRSVIKGESEEPGHGARPADSGSRGTKGARGAGATFDAPDAQPRRIVLSTSIAETSLTVPGVRVVVDSGWARVSRFHPATGLDRLFTERVSISSADQRRGRAGRLGPGLCVRFWRETEPLQPHVQPEILRSDLAGLVLECSLWGAAEPDALHWLDPPPSATWRQASDVLGMLGLAERGRVTERGRAVAALGLHPRLGILALEGAKSGAAGLTAACAAILSERDGSEIGKDPDLRLRLELIRHGSGGRLSWRRLIEKEMRRILSRMAGAGKNPNRAENRPRGTAQNAEPDIGPPWRWTEDQELRAGDLLGAAFPDRIARREPDETYRFVTGRSARLAPTSSLGDWIVAPETDAGESLATIRLCAPMDRAAAERALQGVTREIHEIRWSGLTPKGWKVRLAGRLVLAETRIKPAAEEVAASFGERLRGSGIDTLPWDERSRSLLARMRFFARHIAGSDDDLISRLSVEGLAGGDTRWLLPYVELSGGPVLTPDRLLRALRGLLGRRLGDLEKSAPEAIVLPTGGRRKIDYSSDAPVVEARIQEVFGLAESPRLLSIPIAFKLLSPAHRPLQITSDLASFWRDGYSEVRKQMRGRYARHYWPEDPLAAEPTSRVRPKKKKSGE
jgi:ATP-dependent helicase HrpB